MDGVNDQDPDAGSSDGELTESAENDSPNNDDHELPSLMRRSNSYRLAAQSSLVSPPVETLQEAYLQGRELGNEEAMAKMLIEASKEGKASFIRFILSLGEGGIFGGGDLSRIRSPETHLGPLHYASIGGHKDVVDMLLSEKFSASMEDQHGNTALHLAAGNGHVDTVASILGHESKFNREVSESQRTNFLQQLNADGLSPLGCALRSSSPHYDVARFCLSLFSGSPPASFPDFGKAYLSSYYESILDKPAKIFVLGDRGVGKSTLTKALQESRSVLSKLTFGLVSAGRRIRSSEDKHFAGVISTEFYNPSSKRVIFYDLAGNTNYFNKDLVDSAADVLHSVFIIVVSLKDESTKVNKRLVYWLNFLYHYLHPQRQNKCKPNVVVVGSHNDCRPFSVAFEVRKRIGADNERLDKVFTEVRRRLGADNVRLVRVFTDLQEQNSALANSFSFLLRPLSLDCRKFQTVEMCHFRNNLYRTCLVLAPTEVLPPCTCYILSSLLHSKDFAYLPALTLGKLASIVKANSSRHYSPMSLYHLLPDDVFYLLDICRELEARKRIVLFSNPLALGDNSEMWLVHNSYLILTAIDKKLATLTDAEESAGKDFFKNSQEKFLFSLGIITRETLGRTILEVEFTENTSFVLDVNLAIDLLQHYKYTELVDSVKSSSPVDEAFFFPALLPNEVGEPDRWEGKGFAFALSIQATREGNILTCFLPRFLKKLLLCFIQQFILPIGPKRLQEKDEGVSQLSENEISAMWSRGLSWQVGGVRVHIVTNDYEIILNMHSEPDHEIRCISLRNEIINTIQEEKCIWQEAIETEMFVLPFRDKMFPVETFEACLDHWIPLRDIRLSLLSGKMYYKKTSFASLLFFEPAITVLTMLPSTREILSDFQNHRAILGQGGLLDIYESFGSEKDAIVGHFRLPILGTESSPSVTSGDVLDMKHGGSSRIDDSVGSVSIHTATSTDSEEVNEITCAKFLSHMDSLSIFDFKGFVAEIEYDVTATRIGDPEDLVVDFAKGHSNTPPISDHASSASPILLPSLIGKPKSFGFTSTGGTFCFKEHNITVVFPSGAVTKPTEVQMGVLFTGPFRFPSNTTQVSPILWVCARNKKTTKFSKAFDASLPHFIDCSQPGEVANLVFVKATHDSSFSDKPFVFAEVPVDQTSFAGSNGSVYIKQCCFVCIIHKVPEKVLEKTNFCLVSMVPRPIEAKFELNFCIVHALRTCIENVLTFFPDCDVNKETFKFACNSETPKPSLTIHLDNDTRTGWKAGKTNLWDEIYASDVKLSVGDDEDDNMPPHFTIEVLGASAAEADILHVTITGADRKLGLQKPLDPSTIGRISRDAMQTSLTSISSISRPEKILDRNLTWIVEYVDIDHLRPVLMEQGTILPEEHEKLVQRSASFSEGSTRKNKISIEDLVGMLRHKGSRGIRSFIQALEKTSEECFGHRSVLDILKEDSCYEQIMNSPD